MSTNDTDLTLTAGFDKPTVHAPDTVLRHLVISARAPEGKDRAQAENPLNLALVVDASGSMRGGKLDAARRASAGVIEQLTERDTFSLVSFSSDIQVHADRVRATESGRIEAAAQARRLKTRGCTNLAGGWLRAAECVAQAMEEDAQAGPRRNHVVVLSDGMANEGITQPDTLATHARELAGRGLLSSSVGIGADYQTAQLEAIAEHGGGRLHHAHNPDAIIECILGELDDVRGATVHDLVVTIMLPEGVTAEVTTRCPRETSPDKGTLVCHLGSVLAGRERDLVISLLHHPAPLGTTRRFEVKAGWRRPDDPSHRTTPTRTATLDAVDRATDDAQPRDEARALRAAKAWLSNVTERLVDFNRHGLLDDAKRYYAAQAAPFRAHCRDLDGEGDLLGELERAAPLTRCREPESLLKEVGIRAHKQQRGEVDKRR